MRYILLAGTAVLLFTAMPSVARADCLGDIEAARVAFGQAGQAADPLRQSFDISYETASRMAASSPATCQAIAQRLHGLARLARTPIPDAAPVAAALRAVREEVVATMNAASAITDGAAATGADTGALQAAATEYVQILTFRDAGLDMDGEDWRVEKQDWNDYAHAYLMDKEGEIADAQAALDRAIAEAGKGPLSPEHAERIALARDQLKVERAQLRDAFNKLSKWTDGAKEPANEPVKKEPPVSDLEGYLESICAPEAVLRQGKMVSGCTFWDRRDRIVPGPRKENSYDSEQPVQTIDEVRLDIDYMADQPRAGFRYFLKNHHIAEKGAGGVIEAHPAGGLVIRMDLPRSPTGTARLSFHNGKAIVRGLAEIDYDVRHPAEPLDFTLDRDPTNFVSMDQKDSVASEAADYETNSQTATRANELAHQAVRTELKNNYDKARAKLETALRDQSNNVEGSGHRVLDARTELVQAEKAYGEYLRKNAPEDYKVHVRDRARAQIGPIKPVDQSGPDRARDFVPLDPGSKPGALPEYDGPKGEGPGMPPEQQALADRLESSRNVLREAEARMAAAEGDANAMREAREVHRQAFEAAARARKDYQDYMQTAPKADPDE